MTFHELFEGYVSDRQTRRVYEGPGDPRGKSQADFIREVGRVGLRFHEYLPA
jgi:hypothetical protein